MATPANASLYCICSPNKDHDEYTYADQWTESRASFIKIPIQDDLIYLSSSNQSFSFSFLFLFVCLFSNLKSSSHLSLKIVICLATFSLSGGEMLLNSDEESIEWKLLWVEIGPPL